MILIRAAVFGLAAVSTVVCTYHALRPWLKAAETGAE